jgi:hypothetical protein
LSKYNTGFIHNSFISSVILLNFVTRSSIWLLLIPFLNRFLGNKCLHSWRSNVFNWRHRYSFYDSIDRKTNKLCDSLKWIGSRCRASICWSRTERSNV